VKNTLLENAFRFAHEGIIITDEQQYIVDANDAMQRISGYSRAELIGRKPKIFGIEQQNKIMDQTIRQALQRSGFWHGEVVNKRKDGTYYIAQLSIKRISSSDKVFYLGHLSDVTNVRKYQATLSGTAPNGNPYQFFNKNRLENEYYRLRSVADERHENLVIAFMDLDEFTTINEIHGKAMADRLLEAVPPRVSSVLAETDSIMRCGGDEFVLMLGATQNPEQAFDKLHTILQVMNKPFIVNGVSMLISASIGYTLYPEDNGSLDTLIRHANQSMYKAWLHKFSTIHN